MQRVKSKNSMGICPLYGCLLHIRSEGTFFEFFNFLLQLLEFDLSPLFLLNDFSFLFNFLRHLLTTLKDFWRKCAFSPKYNLLSRHNPLLIRLLQRHIDLYTDLLFLPYLLRIRAQLKRGVLILPPLLLLGRRHFDHLKTSRFRLLGPLTRPVSRLSHPVTGSLVHRQWRPH